MAEVLCKMGGMLVIVEVSPTLDDACGTCPQCLANRFSVNGDWLQCDCGFAYLIAHLGRIDLPTRTTVSASKPFIYREEMSTDHHSVKISHSDAKEMINHPSHYNQGGVECIEAIRSALTEEEFRGFTKGSAIRYLWRAEHKANPIEDLRKAVWYTQYEIDRRVAKAAAAAGA